MSNPESGRPPQDAKNGWKTEKTEYQLASEAKELAEIIGDQVHMAIMKAARKAPSIERELLVATEDIRRTIFFTICDNLGLSETARRNAINEGPDEGPN